MPRKNSSATVATRAPLALRLQMRMLEAVAPDRAAALAERYWFRVPPLPSAQRLARFTPPGGAPFFLMSGESELKGESFGAPDGPLAVLVHGWGGYWQQLAAHMPALVEAGYHVVVYDAPGHGGSTHGAEGPGCGSVLEMADAYRALTAELGHPALVVAHSIGAMAVLRAERGHVPADAYVMIAPQVHLPAAIDWFAAVMGMGQRTRELFLARLQQRVGLQLADFDMVRDARAMARRGPMPALLAVHDTDDPDTPHEQTERLVAAWPGAELMLTNSLGHRQVIWHERVLRRVADFVARPDDGRHLHALSSERPTG